MPCSWTTQSCKELEVHSKIFDYMGFLPASPYNKINIHVGGQYGDKQATMERFAAVSVEHHCMQMVCLCVVLDQVVYMHVSLVL